MYSYLWSERERCSEGLRPTDHVTTPRPQGGEMEGGRELGRESRGTSGVRKRGSEGGRMAGRKGKEEPFLPRVNEY